MLRRIPQCVMIGVDPSKEFGQLFNQIGRFHNVAIGGKSGRYDANVLTFGEKANPWGFEWVTVAYISLTNFVLVYMNDTRLVDFLLLDAEGAEYYRLCLCYVSRNHQVFKAIKFENSKKFSGICIFTKIFRYFQKLLKLCPSKYTGYQGGFCSIAGVFRLCKQSIYLCNINILRNSVHYMPST